MKDTDLHLEIIGKGNVIPPFSARECTQTLSPIPQGILRRTVNGELVCVNGGGPKKFYSVIRCKDKASPAFDGLWKGLILKVGCIQPMTQMVSPESVSIQLERVGFDIHLFDFGGILWPATLNPNRWISIPPDFPGGFITYKPILTMMVKNYGLETDEWGLSVGWTLELEEA